MNRRQFLLGAAAVPIAAVGQQERFLLRTLGVPKRAGGLGIYAGLGPVHLAATPTGATTAASTWVGVYRSASEQARFLLAGFAMAEEHRKQTNV